MSALPGIRRTSGRPKHKPIPDLLGVRRKRTNRIMNYYNEIDSDAAAWLQQLIADGLIPDGYVDERSITEVKPHELTKYTQCHFFAGIGGWSRALELAGWPPDEPVWTGSCPCQPFSSAGKRGGSDDERHLWPAFFALIKACGPVVVFGEQVASADVVGKVSGKPPKAGETVWFDGLCADLEGVGYTAGAAVLGAHSAGADHQRQRLYWVAYGPNYRQPRAASRAKPTWRGLEAGDTAECAGDSGGLGDCLEPRLEGHARHGDDGSEPRRLDSIEAGPTAEAGTTLQGLADDNSDRRDQMWQRVTASGCYGACGDCWADSYPIFCADGKWRRIPTEPALFPLVDGLSYRVGKRGSVRPPLLKGSGNAIVSQTAAMFVRAFVEAVA